MTGAGFAVVVGGGARGAAAQRKVDCRGGEGEDLLARQCRDLGDGDGFWVVAPDGVHRRSGVAEVKRHAQGQKAQAQGEAHEPGGASTHPQHGKEEDEKEWCQGQDVPQKGGKGVGVEGRENAVNEGEDQRECGQKKGPQGAGVALLAPRHR